MIKKMILSVVLLLFVGILVVGCADSGEEPDLPHPDDLVCNADNLGKQAHDGCNGCVCKEYDGNYGWSCTEIYCGEDTPSY
tara:strand:- start:436 stop:678 length:243 start_codon:yes stop_codon:yes gene_type:complete